MTNLDLDERKVGEFVEQVLGVLVGGATAQMAYLGDRLGALLVCPAGMACVRADPLQ
jgi:hypothetical protein